ncbi:hypothetical protein QOZ80_1AG0028260 [Eleusine coracana subsp. coracana]|nr:hypothetical protein QOZ80_1AG0028260 [Eleusine coracana subsp. coracana]
MDTDAAGFKLFGKVIQPPDAHQRAPEESAATPPPPQAPVTPAPATPPPSLLPPQPLPPPAAAAPGAAGGTGEPLPCPRCGSRETKFCYFNNYNVRQPRHLCRACRRYWTEGGALRRVVSASPGRRRPRPSAARSAAAAAAEERSGDR